MRQAKKKSVYAFDHKSTSCYAHWSKTQLIVALDSVSYKTRAS